MNDGTCAESSRHGLPVATRQARIRVGGKSIYLDNLYEEYGICVELDGKVAHPASEQWSGRRGSGCAADWLAAPFSSATGYTVLAQESSAPC